LSITAGAGAYTLTGGSGTNTYHMADSTGLDVLTGGSGNDTFEFGANFTANDQIDGGAGTTNELELDGNYTGGNALVFNAGTMTDINVIRFETGFSYDVTLNAADVTSGQTLTVNGQTLGAGDSLTFDASAVTNATVVFDAGAGSDTLTGGTDKDTFNAGAGVDTFISSGGTDNFVFATVGESTGPTYDTIENFNASIDRFTLAGLSAAITGINTAVTIGVLDSGSNFNTELTADINAVNLSANHAVLFTPNAGTLAGQTFLIIDANGTAGYQAGDDYVINVTGGNLTNLSVHDFHI
jgi:Ca2+-binding RTX toxin-like protein